MTRVPVEVFINYDLHDLVMGENNYPIYTVRAAEIETTGYSIEQAMLKLAAAVNEALLVKRAMETE